MSLKPLFLFACTLCALPLMAQKNYTLTSPDGTLQATVATGSDLRISLSADGETLLAPSPVSMTLGGKPLKRYRIGHDELLRGGRLTFELQNRK